MNLWNGKYSSYSKPIHTFTSQKNACAWPENRLHWLRHFTDSLSCSRQILGQYLKLGYDGFLPYPFQFITHLSSHHSVLYSRATLIPSLHRNTIKSQSCIIWTHHKTEQRNILLDQIVAFPFIYISHLLTVIKETATMTCRYFQF